MHPPSQPGVRSLLVPLVSRACAVSIAVKSTSIGMQGEKEEEHIIYGSKGKYAAHGRTVETQVIEALFRALDEPKVKKPSILNCGIDPALLLSNYESQLQEYLSGRSTGFLHDQSPEALEFYKREFTDSSLAQDAFAKTFHYEKTGWFGEINVDVTVDGYHFVINSASPHLFFLPWNAPDDERGGFNSHISRALAAILPQGFCNRELLLPADERLRWSIVNGALPIIEKRWKSKCQNNATDARTIP
jgi:hypothetical protein